MEGRKYMIMANVQEGCFPTTLFFQNEEDLAHTVEIFKVKGLIRNPDYWMSELHPMYLKASKIRVYELKDEIKSPKVGD